MIKKKTVNKLYKIYEIIKEFLLWVVMWYLVYFTNLLPIEKLLLIAPIILVIMGYNVKRFISDKKLKRELEIGCDN